MTPSRALSYRRLLAFIPAVLVIAIVFFFLYALVNASAGTVYVDDSGSDTTGTGTAGNPYASIQKGVDEAEEQDTVFVKQGTYSENIEVSKRLTLEGETGTVVESSSGVLVTLNEANCKVLGFTFRIGTGWNDRGVEVWGNTCNVSNNRFELEGSSSSPTSPAIYVNSSSIFNLGCSFYGNTITGVGYGLFADKGTSLTVRGNDISNSGVNGIRIRNTNTLTIDRNTISSSKFSGIYLVSIDNTNLSMNTVSDCEGSGIYIQEGNDFSVYRNTLSGNGDSGNDAGILIEDGEGGDEGRIVENECSDNHYGLYLYNSANFTLRKNNLTGNTYNFRAYGQYQYQYVHDVDITNTGDGKRILYLKDNTTEVITAPDAGYIVMVFVEDITLKDLEMINGGYREGIMIAYSTGVILDNVTLLGFEDGVYFRHSSDSTIKNSLLTQNDGNGVFCRGGENIIVEKSCFEVNGGDAIGFVDSTYCYIRENVISGNDGGIDLDSSTHMSVRDNNISSESYAGISLMDSTENTIAGNTISEITSTAFGGGIALQDSDKNSITANTITYCDDSGIYLLRSDENTITENSLSKNSAGITVFTFPNEPVSDNVIENNDIFANTEYGLDASANGDGSVNAVNNYWGDTTGPSHSSNAGGKGNKVSDGVLFDPWLESAYTDSGDPGIGEPTDGDVPAWTIGQSWTWTITDGNESSSVTEEVLSKGVDAIDDGGNVVSCYKLSVSIGGLQIGTIYMATETLILVNMSFEEELIGAFFVSMYLSAIEFPFDPEGSIATDDGDLEVPAGTYHVYKFEGSGTTFWYSPEAGHIVKLEMDEMVVELSDTGGKDKDDDDEGFDIPLLGGYLAGALCMGLCFGLLVIDILILMWVYKDAKRRGESGGKWVAIVFILSLLGLIIWLIVRPKEPKVHGYGIQTKLTKEEKKQKKQEEKDRKKLEKQMKKEGKDPIIGSGAGGSGTPGMPGGAPSAPEPAQAGSELPHSGDIPPGMPPMGPAPQGMPGQQPAGPMGMPGPLPQAGQGPGQPPIPGPPIPPPGMPPQGPPIGQPPMGMGTKPGGDSIPLPPVGKPQVPPQSMAQPGQQPPGTGPGQQGMPGQQPPVQQQRQASGPPVPGIPGQQPSGPPGQQGTAPGGIMGQDPGVLPGKQGGAPVPQQPDPKSGKPETIMQPRPQEGNVPRDHPSFAQIDPMSISQPSSQRMSSGRSRLPELTHPNLPDPNELLNMQGPVQPVPQPQQSGQPQSTPIKAQKLQAKKGGIWICPKCSKKNEKKFVFCMECGFKKQG